MTPRNTTRDGMGPWRDPPPDPRLTDREAQCLTWVARGKSSWETGQICRISENTVNFHLKNAQRKLGAVNRCHALAKALRRGLIEF